MAHRDRTTSAPRPRSGGERWQDRLTAQLDATASPLRVPSGSYAAGIVAAAPLWRSVPRLGPWPWPAALLELGPFRGGQPFAPCARCPAGAHPASAWSFVRYGETALCYAHARAAAWLAAPVGG
jgi:hypothetical protein